MYRNHKRLERATLTDPNFKRIATHFMDDINAHSWEEIGQRVVQLAMKIKGKLMGNKYFTKALDLLMQIK